MHTLQVILSEVSFPASRGECDCARQSTPKAKAWVAASWCRWLQRRMSSTAGMWRSKDRRNKNFASCHISCALGWATTSFKSRWLPSLRGRLQVFKDLAGWANIYLFLDQDTGRRRGRELRERPIQLQRHQRSFETEILSRLLQSLPSFVIFLLHSRALSCIIFWLVEK